MDGQTGIHRAQPDGAPSASRSSEAAFEDFDRRRIARGLPRGRRPVFGSIVRLCILLGQRRSEIGSLRWDWIDREARTIAFPAEVIKNNRVHVIPYVGIAEEIFASIPVLSEHLFPGRDGNATFQGWSKSKRVLDLKSRVKDWTIHDLRRVFSTRVAAYAQPHVLERILNHSAGQISGVASIYNQFQVHGRDARGPTKMGVAPIDDSVTWAEATRRATLRHDALRRAGPNEGARGSA